MCRSPFRVRQWLEPRAHSCNLVRAKRTVPTDTWREARHCETREKLYELSQLGFIIPNLTLPVHSDFSVSIRTDSCPTWSNICQKHYCTHLASSAWKCFESAGLGVSVLVRSVIPSHPSPALPPPPHHPALSALSHPPHWFKPLVWGHLSRRVQCVLDNLVPLLEMKSRPSNPAALSLYLKGAHY